MKHAKLLQAAIFGIALAIAMSASADVTFSGADLATLTYHGALVTRNLSPGHRTWRNFTTPDSGPNGDAPVVYVQAINPLATSSLST